MCKFSYSLNINKQFLNLMIILNSSGTVIALANHMPRRCYVPLDGLVGCSTDTYPDMLNLLSINRL